MADSPIILNNSGDNSYNFLGREWTAKPVKCDYVKLFLSESTLAKETLTIETTNSTGIRDKREISLLNYISAEDKNNNIVLIPFKPELILDGSTFFKIRIPAQSEILMVFYYKDQLVTLS